MLQTLNILLVSGEDLSVFTVLSPVSSLFLVSTGITSKIVYGFIYVAKGERLKCNTNEEHKVARNKACYKTVSYDNNLFMNIFVLFVSCTVIPLVVVILLTKYRDPAYYPEWIERNYHTNTFADELSDLTSRSGEE